MWSAFASLRSFAEAEKINPSYIARVLRLTLLAPDIVEAILYGQQPAGLQLDDLLTPFPVEWERQKRVSCIPTPTKVVETTSLLRWSLASVVNP
jgi:hypothetical protein